jgi:hypothetical protein
MAAAWEIVVKNAVLCLTEKPWCDNFKSSVIIQNGKFEKRETALPAGSE